MKTKLFSRKIPALLLTLALLLTGVLAGCGVTELPKDNTDTTAESEEETHPEGAVSQEISVVSRGGLNLSDVTVTVKGADGEIAATKTTDENGVCIVWLLPGTYTVTVSGLPVGYTAEGTTVTVTADGGKTKLVADSAVIDDAIPSGKKAYYPGDVIYDFTYRTNEGESVKISDLLKDKKLVVINFWADWCSNCKAEFPALQSAYAEYADQVEVVALNNSDSASFCDEFRDDKGYSFTMVPDANGLYNYFTTYAGGLYLPISVFVDRYGVIAEIVTGADTDANSWKNTFAAYISDDYVQTAPGEGGDAGDDTEIEKPDVTMPDSSEIEQAINGQGFSTTYRAPESEYIWPWVLNEDRTAIQPANYGKHSSNAMITFDVTLQASEFFAFDYRYSIEYDTYGTETYDLLAVYVDNELLQTLVKPQDGWVTCYAFTPLAAGTHTITLLYSKDSTDSKDFMDAAGEYVYVKNLRTVSLSELVSVGGSANVRRPAAWGTSADSTKKTYANYANVVFSKADGYYHVGTENGPLLLARLCGATQWSSTSLEDLAYNGYLKIDNVDYSDMMPEFDSLRSYWWLEGNSDLGYTPVDDHLAQLLDLFAEKLGNGANHELEWLEFCYYFDHYGAGNGITKVTDVRTGIDAQSALTATLGKNHAQINRVLVPRGLFYAFTPDETGVYTFYSIAEGASTSYGGTDITTIAWLYDSDGQTTLDSGENSEHFKIWHTLEAGKTYYIAVGLDPVDYLGEFYFKIEKMTDASGNILKKLDIMTVCTDAWTFGVDDDSSYAIWRNYDFHAALGTDGYYHQILGYNADGSAILDYSETGYVYADFLGLGGAEGASYITWLGDWCTLQKCIEQGYYTTEPALDNDGNQKVDEDGNLLVKPILNKDFFDFTKRVDGDGNSLADLGNHQATMEKYLEIAKNASGDEYGFVRVDAALAEILDIVIELYSGFSNVEDQWLMFCCFMRHV